MTRFDAISIAKHECENRGWPWLEPIQVFWRPFSFRVLTHANCRGGNVVVRIRKRDGAVLHSGFCSR